MMTQEINPKTGKKAYYKDNPETKRIENGLQMRVNGKYIPILQFSNKKDKDFMPIYPFDDPDPRVTAGHLARSLVQSAAEILMTPEKNEKFEALKTGGLMLLAGGGALLIIALMGNIQGGAA